MIATESRTKSYSETLLDEERGQRARDLQDHDEESTRLCGEIGVLKSVASDLRHQLVTVTAELAAMKRLFGWEFANRDEIARDAASSLEDAMHTEGLRTLNPELLVESLADLGTVKLFADSDWVPRTIRTTLSRGDVSIPVTLTLASAVQVYAISVD